MPRPYSSQAPIEGRVSVRIRRAGVQLDDGLRMGGRIGVQAAEEAEFIDVLARCAGRARDPGPGLPVLRELEFRRGQRAAAGADFAVIVSAACGLYSKVSTCDIGPFHEQEDDPLGLHREVGRFGRSGSVEEFLPSRLQMPSRSTRPKRPASATMPSRHPRF